MASGQHTLNPSYKDLWKNQVGGRTAWDPNGELMFQVGAIGRTASADAKVGFYNGPSVVDPATQATATGTNGVFMLPTYFYLFDSTDIRRDVTCAPYQDTLAPNGTSFYKKGQSITSIFDGKYRRDWLQPPMAPGSYANNYTGFKWQILRYSDVVLMFAEAENELNGPTAAAYNAINMVRRRGFGKAIGSADASVDIPAGLGKDEFFKYLVKERSLELGDEGVRKFDLIRWNLLGKAIDETKNNINKMSNFQVMTQPSYMANYPSYVLNTANLPTSIYYVYHSTSDDLSIGGGLVANSFYRPAPSAAPAGGTYTKVTWISNTAGSMATSVLSHYATNFAQNKSELLPIPQDAITAYGGFASNMPQNPGY